MHFFTIYGRKNKKELKNISPKTMDLLCRYDWPGNIRELENCVERAVIMARQEIIVPEDLPANIRVELPGEEGEGALCLLPGISLAAMEKALILKTLQDAGDNRTRAAEILGINRRTLQNKLKEYGIQ